MQKNLKKRACLPTALSERLIFLIISVSLILFAVFILKIRNRYITKNPEDFIPPSSCDKLMIVAHPDDETIFGGAHLLDGGWLVAVVTAGHDFERAEELLQVMKKTGNTCIMLGYPDKYFGLRSEWKSCYPEIEKKLESLITKNNWTEIVTHNKYGEYGHIHHRLVHKMVSGIAERNTDIQSNLSYFGKYYSKKSLFNSQTSPLRNLPMCYARIPSAASDPCVAELISDSVKNFEKENPRLDGKIFSKKAEILYGCYKSQSWVLDGLAQTFQFESFIPYTK